MKFKYLFPLGISFCCLFNSINSADAQGTAFTYQGRLNNNNAPATGSYDFLFTIYDSSGGPSVIAGPVSLSAVAVSNGLFVVTLDFGSGVFAGLSRWLGIEVRTNGAGVFSTLNPRQALTPTPYAVFANTASNVVSGAAVKTLNNLKDNVTLAAGTNVTITPNGNTLTIASAGVGGSGIWSVLNNNTYYNAGNVGIGTTTPSLYGHGGTGRILEINNSGTTMHSQSHLMLFTGVNSLQDSAMGSVTWAQPGGMAAFIGAHTRSTTPNAPAAMLSFGTRKIGDGAASTKMVITEDGNVGIGTTTPAVGVRLDISGTVRVTPGGSGGFLSFAAPNGETGLGAIGANRFDLRFDGDTLKLAAGPGTGPPPAQFGITLNTNGNVGIGMANPLVASQWKLDVSGPMRVSSGGSGGVVQVSAPNGESGLGIVGVNRADLRFDGSTLKLVAGAGISPPSALNGIAITTSGNVGIGTTTPIAKLQAETGLASTAAVYGSATGSGGVGVYGQSTAAGLAVYAAGHAAQSRDKSGFVKAMAYVNSSGEVIRCYNSATGSSSGNCGITSIHSGNGVYRINFGFQVNDRFISVTPQKGGGNLAGYNYGANFIFVPDDPTSVDVLTFDANDGDDTYPNAFMIFVF